MLHLRILSVLLFVPPTIFFIFSHPLLFLIFVLGICIKSEKELSALLKKIGYAPFPYTLLFLLLLCLCGLIKNPIYAILVCCFFLFLLAALLLFEKVTFDTLICAIFSLLYIGLPCFSFLWIKREDDGLLFFLFFVTWITNMGAYFTGRHFGKRRFFQKISPSKTAEGTIGSIPFGLVTAIILQKTLVPIPLSHAIGLSIAIFFLAHVGDLFESFLKRKAGVKDADRLFPEYGGVLDIFDSLFFVSPFVLWYLVLHNA